MDWISCSTKGMHAVKDKQGNIVSASVPSIPTLSCIGPLIATLISWMLVFAGVVAIFIIIYSGIKYINSGGDSKAVETARKTFTYALLGLILVLSSFAIVGIVSTVTGVTGLTNFTFK